jgi:hypothetical protein
MGPSMSAAALFDPAEVSKILNRLPHLRAQLAVPDQEGEPSDAFPKARKSPHQIYRVLANTHYRHLEALLDSLEFCVDRGFTQPALLHTRARTAFVSALSELHVAEHLLLQGFEVEGLDTKKGPDPVPELIARGHNLALAVEVYCPRAREGLDELLDEFTDVLKNLDLAFDFRFEVRVDQLERFDSKKRLLFIHPQVLARGLDSKTRSGIVAPMLDEAAARLEADSHPIQVVRDEPDLNIKVTIEINDIQPCRSHLPARIGIISPPGLSGYAPEGMFDRLVRRGVRDKARKGQAPRSKLAPLSLLVVDLSRSEMTTGLPHPSYRRSFEKSLRDKFGAGLLGYDFIAICESTKWGERLHVHFLLAEDRVPSPVQDRMNRYI